MYTPDRIKKALRIRTDRELAALIGVHPAQIPKWRREGIGKSPGRIIDLLLKRIEGDGQKG